MSMGRRAFEASPWMLATACLCAGATPPDAPQPLRVGYAEHAPEIFTDEENEVRGFLPELFEALLEPTGIELHYLRCDREQCLQDLSAGRLDLVPNVERTEAQAERVRFGDEAVLLAQSALFTRRDGVQPVPNELDGARLAVLEHSQVVHHLESMAEREGWALHLATKSSEGEILDALRRGEVDYGVIDQAYGDRHAKALGLRRTTPSLHADARYLAFRPDMDARFIETLNSRLAKLKMQDDSSYHQLSRRWHRSASARPATPAYGQLALVLTLGLLFTTAVAGICYFRTQQQRHVLWSNQERETAVTEALGLGIWEWNLQPGHAVWSPSMYRLYGRDPSSEAPRMRAWLEYVHPQDRERIQQRVEVGVTPGTGFQDEFRIVREDGEVRHLRAIVQTGVNSSGRAQAMGVHVDITDSYKLQLQLQQAEKMKAVGQLTGGIAHDFNNRLMVIRNNLSMAIEDQTDEEVVGMLQDALGAAEACAALTGRLLAFSRQRELTLEPTELNRSVRRAARLLRRTLPATIEIVLELEPTPLWSSLDENLLENAMLDLAINARDAMSGRGRLRFRTLPGPESNVIRVEDDGRGMSPETLQRALEPFFTTKPVGRGTGLGLAMVHGFVHQTGGEVSLESVEGAGTVVQLSFPIVPEPEDYDAAQTGDLPAPLEVGRVLICEDDDDVQVLLRRLCSHLGLDHRIVGTADDALEALARDPNYDVVLSDVVMPGSMDGIELAHRLRLDYPGLAVVLMSGYTRRSESDRPPPPDDVSWLRKPFSKARLAHALETAAAQRTDLSATKVSGTETPESAQPLL